MAEIQVKIKNLPEIKAAFGRAPMLMGRELNKAIVRSTLSIQGETQINVMQRDIRVVTGGLKSAVQRSARFENLKGIIEVDIPYGIFVHEGTRFMKSRPFLKRAVESKDKDVQGFFTDAVDNVLSVIGKAT